MKYVPLTLKFVYSFPDSYSPLLTKHAQRVTPDLYIRPHIKLNLPLQTFSFLKKWHNIHSAVQERTLQVIIHTAIVDTRALLNSPLPITWTSPSCWDYWPLSSQLPPFSRERSHLPYFSAIVQFMHKSPLEDKAKPQLHTGQCLCWVLSPSLSCLKSTFLKHERLTPCLGPCIKRTQPWTLPIPFYLLMSFQIYIPSINTANALVFSYFIYFFTTFLPCPFQMTSFPSSILLFPTHSLHRHYISLSKIKIWSCNFPA